jgi:hypothetical protein
MKNPKHPHLDSLHDTRCWHDVHRDPPGWRTCPVCCHLMPRSQTICPQCLCGGGPGDGRGWTMWETVSVVAAGVVILLAGLLLMAM